MQHEPDNLSEREMSEEEAAAWVSVILDIHERLLAKEAKDKEAKEAAA
jgi:hypothetical protein